MLKEYWIKAPADMESAAPAFVKKIRLKEKVKSARLRVSSMGIFAFFINGRRVGDEVMTPGWTNYRKRIQYIEFDVTDMLTAESELKAIVGPGWAVGRIGFQDTQKIYSDHVSVTFELELAYTDGTCESFCSDEACEVYTSEVLATDIYDGETIDRSCEKRFVGNALKDKLDVEIVEQRGEKITEQDTVYPSKLIKTPKGETVIDFGQNMTGYVEVRIKGSRGDCVAFHHGEILDKDGNFYNANYRTAKAQARYILSGDGEECFKPMLTFFGFRYICIDEFPGEVDLKAFRAIAVHSDIRRTGSFVCGNEKINQLYHNIIWGQKSNYLDVPTDCPQRDERLGWTGDAQVFVRTGAMNFDVYKFFEKWFEDMITEQMDSGAIPYVIPDCLGLDRTSAAWGDAAVIFPWEFYIAYGKKEILELCFPMMKKWIEYIRNFGEDEYLWIGGVHYGDWLAMDGDKHFGGTDADMIASCYYAYSTSLFIKAGEALGKDMSEYKDLLEKIKAAVNERFVKDGLPICRTQTACAMLLSFDINRSERIAELLAELVRENGSRLATGFVGTPILPESLSAGGHTELAYELLLQEKFPSWLFSVNMGATTMWEHWDGVNENGEFWDVGMNSFNHYAYGSVGDWMFGTCAGIKIVEAGYKRIKLAPVCDKRMGFVSASIDTVAGRVSSSWYYRDDGIHFEFEVPQGSIAEIVLPDGRSYEASGGSYMFIV